MAKDDKVKQARQKARFAAMEAKKPAGGLPVPPRKAMSRAKKNSKKLAYPVPPYPRASLLQLYRWASYEWWQLGRWRNLAAPVVLLVAALTWEKEQALKEARWLEIDKEDARRHAAEMYVAFDRPNRKKKKKLLGIIPMPGRK